MLPAKNCLRNCEVPRPEGRVLRGASRPKSEFYSVFSLHGGQSLSCKRGGGAMFAIFKALNLKVRQRKVPATEESSRDRGKFLLQRKVPATEESSCYRGKFL